MDEDLETRLQQRLGSPHARQRLSIEREHEAQAFGQSLNLLNIENWYSVHAVIRTTLRLCGLYGRGLRNAERVELRRNDVSSKAVPAAFDGFTLLHLSDLHLDMNPVAMQRVASLAAALSYDICVLTGDYRGKTYGPFQPALDALAELRQHLHAPVYGVLGNHDTIQMLPALEDMGIRMLVNETEILTRGDERIHIAGIDDAHFFQVGNIEKAGASIPRHEFSLLLSHTPEVYRQAAQAGFDLMLSGHTHGGQICLPGSIPLTLDSTLPRRFGAGAWQYQGMNGYTSVGAGSCIVPVRLNCPPEITLHRLLREA
jgi:predicted MPP superfamily phosphohydrolase